MESKKNGKAQMYIIRVCDTLTMKHDTMLNTICIFRTELKNIRLSKRICNKKLPGVVVVHACDSSTWELWQGDHEFKASLDYTVRPYLKKKKNL
jgi:hypothetical protein